MTDRCPHYAGGVRAQCYWCHRADLAHARVQLQAQCDWWHVADALRRAVGLGIITAALCLLAGCVPIPEPADHCAWTCAHGHLAWRGETMEDPNAPGRMPWCVCEVDVRRRIAIPPRRMDP